MSLFCIAPPHTPIGTDAWRVRLEVDPSDWAEASDKTKAEFVAFYHGRYVDSNGNSPYDLIEIEAGGRIVSVVELFTPPRRSGPEGADGNVPSYVRGPK